MQDYQERVVEEKAELDGRITKLGDFLMTEKSQKIPFDEHERMTKQMKLMMDLSMVLCERINAFD